MPGEKGGVKVDAAKGRDSEHLLGKDLSISSHHNDIGAELSERFNSVRFFETFRLPHLDPMPQGCYLHYREGWRSPSPRRLIGLSEDRNNLMLARDKTLKAWHTILW